MRRLQDRDEAVSQTGTLVLRAREDEKNKSEYDS
jgi:hypothetical protein